jgi:hypothetical protein
LLTVFKQATTHLAKTEQRPDPLKEAPALKRKIEKALAMHHGALTAQIEAVMAAWELLQQQVVADMSWRELEMQVGHGFEALRFNDAVCDSDVGVATSCMP